MKKLLLTITSLALSGCAYLQSVSTTPVPQDRTNIVQAESYRFIFLLLNFNNNYVDEMVSNLSAQCPNGQIKGILTKNENIMYFPIIAHANRVTATGYCVKPSARAQSDSLQIGMSQ